MISRVYDVYRVLYKNAKCLTYHFKGLHTFRVVKNKVKSHKIFKTTTLRRQSFAEDEKIIK